jgi:pSer/pThr/pTyr-binding forkhead associated (FHA) protein
MNVVLVMFKGKERRDFPVSGEKTILGRRQDCQLRIPTRDVSRQHCALVIRNEMLIAQDLGSSNGTFVNDKRIAEVQLQPGDRLRIGPVTFVVQIDDKPADIRPQDTAPHRVVEPSLAGDEEETIDLSEADLDLDDPLSALERKDEDDDLP